jgi:hypothetical protein
LPVVVIPEIVSELAPLLSVKFAEAEEPTFTEPKLLLVGFRLTEELPALAPVPVNGTVCGLLDALSSMVRVPDTVPTAVGLNVMEIVHVVAAANVLGDNGQFDVWPKFPKVEMFVIVSGAGWLFLTVIGFDALVVFTVTLPIAKLAGDKTTGAIPLPVKAAV